MLLLQPSHAPLHLHNARGFLPISKGWLDIEHDSPGLKEGGTQASQEEPRGVGTGAGNLGPPEITGNVFSEPLRTQGCTGMSNEACPMGSLRLAHSVFF